MKQNLFGGERALYVSNKYVAQKAVNSKMPVCIDGDRIRVCEHRIRAIFVLGSSVG